MSERAGSGFRAFLLIWAGQSVSLLGSRLTSFALSVWAFERTGSVTLFGWTVLLGTLPGLLAAPWAGALVDRWSRRWVLILCDAGSALVTLAAMLLLAGGQLQIWHLCILLAVGSVFDSFQQPAYLAAVARLVAPGHLGRTSGMMQLSMAGARILAPGLAGWLIHAVGLPSVLMADFVSFLAGILTLTLVRLPAMPAMPATPEITTAASPSLWREIGAGWRYIRERPGLLRLAGLLAGAGFLMSMLEVLMLPLLLTFASVTAAGVVSSAVGMGMLLGSLAMSAWGGPRRRIHGILGFALVQGVALAVAGLRPDLALVTVAFFVFALSMPVVDGCDQTVWQSKTPAPLQGRVFAFRRLCAQSVAPLGMLVAGPLADRVFEPLLARRGLLAASAGRIFGTGPGRGMGLMLTILGIALVALVLAASSSQSLRRLEDDLPDAPPNIPNTPESLADAPQAAPQAAPQVAV